MKHRIKIDSFILSSIIILTGFLYLFPDLYSYNQTWDDIFDALGIILILKGSFLRMSARGHKKAHSHKGEGLVMTGPYAACRNPMYLGSFLIGAGFVLLVWPWWSLAIFSMLFYLRFNPQMVKEEAHLKKAFSRKYEQYCKTVPRIFPAWDAMRKLKTNEVFHWGEAFSTKEKRNLWVLPLLAVLLETFQEWVVFGVSDLDRTVLIFAATTAVFFIILRWSYQKG